DSSGAADYTPHTISADGSRIVFTAAPFVPHGGVNGGPEGEGGDLYMRIDGRQTIHLNASERTDCADHNPCGGTPEPDPAGHQPAEWGGASRDNSKVFFMSSELLTDDATPGGGLNLYKYDVNAPAGHHLTWVSKDTNPNNDFGGNSRARAVV